jgi:phosphopantetheinyl transferase (holo-ACP synthase)
MRVGLFYHNERERDPKGWDTMLVTALGRWAAKENWSPAATLKHMDRILWNDGRIPMKKSEERYT